MPFQSLNLTSVSKPTSSFLPLGSSPTPTLTSTPTPSLMDQGISAAKSYADSSSATVPSFGQDIIDAVTHPLKSTQTFAAFVAQPFFQNTQSAGEAAYNLATDKGVANKVADTAHLISGIAGAAFSPITSTFNVAETIPGAKQVADTLNIPFEVLGKAGSWSTGKIVDYLPIPQESKDIIKQPLQDLGSLASQVVFGGKVMDRVTELSNKGTEITPEVAKKIVEEVKQEVPAPTDPGFQPLKTPAELHTDYAKSQGYEPYVPHDQLPTIEAGATPKEGLPTIQTEAPVSNKLGDLTVEPIKPPASPEIAPQATKEGIPSPYQEPKLINQEVKPTESSNVQPVQTEPGVSKIGKSIEAKAVEARLTTGFDKTALHEGTSFPEQAKLGAEEVAKGNEHINSVISGETPLPERLQPAGFIAAVEEHLAKNPDVEMQYRLANSKIVTETSRQASGLSIARMRVQDSATAKLQEIRKARESQVKDAPKRTSATRSSVKSEVKKVNLTPEDLGKIDKFIDSILC